MKKKRRAEITVETRWVILIRRPRGSERVWCRECAADIKVITPEEAVVLTRVSSRAIFRWVETDRLHFSETPRGLLLICLNSLFPSSSPLLHSSKKTCASTMYITGCRPITPVDALNSTASAVRVGKFVAEPVEGYIISFLVKSFWDVALNSDRGPWDGSF